jgi:hypothetical protein
MEDKILTLKQLGFTDSQITQMNKTFKNTLKLSPNNLKGKFEVLLSYGLSEEQTMYFLIHTPSIFGMATLSLKKKFEIYREAFGDRFIEVLSKNPRRLILGSETARERLNLLKPLSLPIDQLENDLFMSTKQFKRKYGLNEG